MSASAAADAVVLVHLAFIGFVVLGGLLVVRWNALAWLHLPAVAWGAWIEFTSSICPLKPLENHLRRLAGEAAYTGGFIERYVVPLIYPPGLTPGTQWWLGAAVIGINAAVYAWVLTARLRSRRERRGGADLR